jgi:hypothetical protein
MRYSASRTREGGGTVELKLSTTQIEDLRSCLRGQAREEQALELVVRPAAQANGIALAW